MAACNLRPSPEAEEDRRIQEVHWSYPRDKETITLAKRLDVNVNDLLRNSSIGNKHKTYQRKRSSGVFDIYRKAMIKLVRRTKIDNRIPSEQPTSRSTVRTSATPSHLAHHLHRYIEWKTLRVQGKALFHHVSRAYELVTKENERNLMYTTARRSNL